MLSVIAKIKVIENVRVDPDAGPSLNSNNFTPQLLASGLLPKRKEQIMNKIRLIYKRLGNGKGENQGSHLRRVEIYKWFLRSEINKADINSVKNVLMQLSWKLGGPVGTPAGPTTIRGLKKSALFTLVWRNLKI